MDKLTRQFFGDAKRLHMNPVDKAEVWDQISMRASSSPVSLSSREKADGFAKIAQHMQHHPMPMDQHPMRHFFALHRMGAMAMCAILLVGASGGGVAYAAEDAMPEDVLYSVKLHFNEPLIGAFKRSPEDKAAWEQRRLERRLHEAEHLSNRPEFIGAKREMLEQRIEDRMNAFQKHIENVPEDKRLEIEERLQKRFDEHEDFLEKLEEGVLPKEEVKKFKKRMIDVHSRIKHPGPPPPREDNNRVFDIRPERDSEQKFTPPVRSDLQNTRNIAPSLLRNAPQRPAQQRR